MASPAREGDRPGFAAAIAAVAAVALLLCLVIIALPRLALVKQDQSERFVLYLEGLKPAGKLVLLSATERYVASKEFTARVLALLMLEARIEISAFAEASYYVDLERPSDWAANWDGRSRLLRLRAPAPGVLPPAVRTDTIEIRSEGANLVTSAVFRLKKETEAMRDELSAELEKRARAALADPALRERLKASLAGLARGFCSSILRIEPRSVEVEFGK